MDVDTINSPTECQGVTEIPVSVIKKTNQFLIFKKSHYCKIDIEQIRDASDIHTALSLFGKEDTVILFAHSFSFLIQDFNETKQTYHPFKVDTSLVSEFKTLLKRLHDDPTMTFITINETARDGKISTPHQYNHLSVKKIIRKCHQKICR